MSLREFLDADCGQLNPVLKVATHFTQDVSLRDTLAAGIGLGAAAAVAGASSSAAHHHDPYLHQDVSTPQLLPPTTFQMDSLLREIQSMENSQIGPHPVSRPVPAPSVADYARQSSNWAEEFRKDEHSLKVTSAAWANDYFAAELDPVWDNAREPYSLPMPLHHHPHGAPHISQFDQVNYQLPTAKELLNDDKWADDFAIERHYPLSSDPLSNTTTTTIVPPNEKTELRATAEDFLKSVSDPSIQATEFMNYVEKISSGEITFDENRTETEGASATTDSTTASNPLESTSDVWASEYTQGKEFQAQSINPVDWAEEYASQEHHLVGPPSGTETDEGKEDFWMKLQEEWDRLAQEEDAASTHPWLTESALKQLSEQQYAFNDENPFIEAADPLSEGKKKLIEGDIPSAVLLFESAVQKYPDNPECWLLLGTTQAQNEKDPLAITALNKCLEIQPDNLTALMALAASLTNESLHLQASNALKRWLKFNPKYSSIIQEDVSPLISRNTSILPSEELLQVQRWFMQAARINPTTGIDPDVQSGLGVLFNLGAEYDKAADCFQAALSVNPDDSLLWNRLGATLANGGKSAEAIGAYRRSLEISPGFIRTRYNLGISCINLGVYREAAEHFLSSLNIQAAGRSGQNSAQESRNVMSDSIWSSLRMILHLLDRSDLTHLVDSRDLQALNKQFQINS